MLNDEPSAKAMLNTSSKEMAISIPILFFDIAPLLPPFDQFDIGIVLISQPISGSNILKFYRIREPVVQFFQRHTVL